MLIKVNHGGINVTYSKQILQFHSTSMRDCLWNLNKISNIGIINAECIMYETTLTVILESKTPRAVSLLVYIDTII